MSNNQENMTRELLQKAKAAVMAVEPEAELYLFGSRARGDHNEASDWDFLVLLLGRIDYERKSRVIDCLFELELQHDTVFNIIIQNKEKWIKDEVLHVSPFYLNVESDKIAI
jgi:predicted nucleotidyltransferase